MLESSHIFFETLLNGGGLRMVLHTIATECRESSRLPQPFLPTLSRGPRFQLLGQVTHVSHKLLSYSLFSQVQ
jgi:hypothetical protein